MLKGIRTNLKSSGGAVNAAPPYNDHLLSVRKSKKMKFVFLFCTKLRVYLTELPVILLLAIAIHYNDGSDELFKLYPLQIFLGLVILFILVYFFRAITITYDEIRYHGLFSSRDSAVINKDKTLIITMKPARRLTVELFGNDGKLPALDWLKDSEAPPVDIFLFRGKAVGGKRTVSSVLKYFGVPAEDISEVFSKDGYTREYDDVILDVEKKEDICIFKIKMKETV